MATEQDFARQMTSLVALAPTPPEWESLSQTYQGWSQESLLAELTRINSLLAMSSQSQVVDALQSRIQELDQPVLRQQRMVDQSPPADRGHPASRQSQPGAFDLLVTSMRAGPRLAAKVVRANAEYVARRKAEGTWVPDNEYMGGRAPRKNTRRYGRRR